MATQENINKDSSYWYNKFTTSPSDVRFRIHGKHYRLDKKLLIEKSRKFAMLLKDHKNEELAVPFKNIPGDSTAFELAMKFCQGYEPNLTAVNIVPVICLAFYLEMTKEHCQGNLLDKAFNFFHLKILPHWNESVEAFQTMEHHFEFAIRLGLVDSCLESLLSKARDNPRLLGEPFKKPTLSDTGADYRPIVRKKLFSSNQQASEALTLLSLRLYELIVSNMIQNGVQPEYVAASLFRYAEAWATVNITGEAVVDSKEVIETVEKLLPDEKIVLPCKLLFEMLRTAIFFHASPSCRYGFEMRIRKQLNEAVVEDLLTPSQGYAAEVQFDIDCVKRILQNFYAKYTSSETSGLIKVAELIEDYLAKLADDVNLTKDSFISLCAISVATTIETKGYSDGVYPAIDIYLDRHNYLTESEKEEVCQVLDCSRMSEEARIHASQNSRLPLRVVVQALFVGQLHLRDVITTRVDNSDNGSRKEEIIGSEASEDARIEMDNRVIELENECDRMKRQIEEGVVKEKKNSKWKALKRKFGCMNDTFVLGIAMLHELGAVSARKVAQIQADTVTGS
ncbi:BTB/POZ domain-containing protein At5g17580-like [Papaver somniferum]|uniref:BTB/POZ domain-containing protein At5g17580-like n=1 Tax=Papaver somniferum TaxID=3469 RepID=UPI000E70121E|nr:BTB/POZ domain-containing protein At5g17580-like [Papaver somniferum]